jgi:hypothetical protein
MEVSVKAVRSPSVRVLEQRREAWIRKLAGVGPLTRGSLVTAQRGGHLARQLTVSVKGRTHTVYVPADMAAEVSAWTENHRRLQRIVREISKLSMAIIHRHVPARRAAARGARSP